MNLLKPNKIPILTFVRYARPERHKLKKPEDKSTVILGKRKESFAFPKPGVSDKAVRIFSCLI